MSLQKKVVNGAKWTTFSTVILSILQLVQLVVLVRLLDAEAFGLMGMVIVVIGFADVLTDMGISNAIIHKQDIPRKHLSSLYWTNVFAGISIFVFLQLLTPVIVSFFNEPEIETLVRTIGLYFLILPFGQQYQVILQKELKFEILAKIDVISTILSTIVAITYAYFHASALALVLGQLFNIFIRTSLLIIYGHTLNKIKFHFKITEINDYLKFGLYQTGERLINHFSFYLDTLFIGKILGAQTLGFYTLANNIINLPASRINPIITRVAFPAFSKVQNDNKLLRAGYLKIIQILSIINFPLFIGLMLASSLLVPIVFGAKWLESVILLQILCIAGLFRSVSNPIGSILLAKGRADIGFKFNLLKMLFQIIFIILGMFFLGIIGVAFAKVLLYAFDLVIGYKFILNRLIGINLKKYLNVLFKPFVISLIMGFAIIMTQISWEGLPELYLLILEIIVGLLVYSYLTIMSIPYLKMLFKRVLNAEKFFYKR